MTYPDSLLDALGDAHHSDAGARLAELFKSFRMYPDVRDDLRDEFWKREGLFHVIMNNINALSRLKEIIRHALEFNGNVAVNFVGEPRIGKSTVARWASQEVYKIQFKTLKGWKDRLLFARSYSRATEQLSLITKRFVDEGLDDVAVLEQLKGYCLIEDENQLEHEKDSVKAKDDMTNISESCASSGIHFLYLSPKRRGFGYCTILVVGIDPKRRLNLSFYLDNKGTFRGYLITPEVLPIEEYTEQKNRTVVQTLLDRGRVTAEVVQLGEAKGIGEPSLIEIPPDADFMQTLESYARSYLQPLVKKPEIVERWILRYLHGYTYPKISQELDIGRADTVGDSIRDLEGRISKTRKGDILEAATCDYLNRTLLGIQTPIKESEAIKPNLSEDFPLWRRGWRGCDVAVPDRVAVNCKWIGEVRSSYHVDCLPEVEVVPGEAYVLYVVVTPQQRRHGVHQCTDPSGHTLIGKARSSDNFVPWEEWLERMQSLIESASSVPSADASDPDSEAEL